MLPISILLSFFAIFFGLIFGSFINVITYRLPNNKSILKPRSFCPNCKKTIPWHENIPILSWIRLKGKCSSCHQLISINYPITEVLTGILFLLSFKAIPSDVNFANFIFTLISNWSFIIILIPIAIIDSFYLWIPNSLIKVGILLGFFISIIFSFLNYQNIFIDLIERLISGIIGFLIIIIIIKFGELIYKKPAMGMGDAKLAAMLGIWLGFPGVLISIWISFLIAGVFVILGLFFKKICKGQLIPFGPFLSISGFLTWIYSDDVFLNIIF